MLNRVIKRAYYLNKHLEAPLLKERQEYGVYLDSKGLSRHTLKCVADYFLKLIVISFWLLQALYYHFRLQKFLLKFYS